MSYLNELKLLASYNSLLNQRVFKACASLSYEQLAADRGAFFGSVLVTLNHIMVGDLIWLNRFACLNPRLEQNLQGLEDFPKPTGLRQQLYSELDAFTLKREQLDRLIVDFVAALREGELQSRLSYHNTQGQAQTKRFGHLLLHLFNHQTHHRGQVSTLLNQSGLDLGATDLLELIDE